MGITTLRSSSVRGGLAAIVAGLLLAVFGFVGPAAGAGQGQGNERGSVTVCHRGNAVDNPYQQNPVSYSAVDGSMTGSNHTSHGGPVFDFGADPADLDYPYHPPMDGDEWGDIIPPYSWDGGSFPGQNWDEVGQAIWNADCQDPSETQPETEDVCEDVEGVQTDVSECEIETDVCEDVEGVQTDPSECEIETDVCEDVEGVQTDASECEIETDVCPQPGVQTDADDCPPQPPVDVCEELPGLQTDPADCDAQLIPPVVIENLPPQAEAPEVVPTVVPRKPVEVQGVQVLPSRQTLPRTGSSTTVLAQVGLGLVLLGAGAVVAGRKPITTA